MTSSYAIIRKALNIVVVLFMIVYAVITLLPFYMIFVRSFVSTREALRFHFWIPPAEDVNLDADIGNLSVFYSLDLRQVKRDLGIPETDYLNPRMTLKELSVEYAIPEARMQQYFRPFIRYNGWIVLVRHPQFLGALGRTTLLTVVGLIGMNLLSMLTGSGLAGFRHRYQMSIYNLYLVETALPIMLILVPQFMVLQSLARWLAPGYDLGGPNRMAGQLGMLLLLYVRGGPLQTMIYTAFISTIPQELEDAAAIDGASRWQYIWRVQGPLMKIPAASVTMAVLPGLWNDFLQPFVYLDMKNTTLLPLIQGFAGEYSTNFQVIYAGICVSILPLVLIFVLFRRYFVMAQLSGAVKG